MAPTMVGVVRSAGGWLFDQVMAGWDVTVLTTDDADARPAHILGARAGDLEAVLARRVRGSCLREAEPSSKPIAITGFRP
jgi:hypothetical protein